MSEAIEPRHLPGPRAPQERSAKERSAEERSADHAAIDRLANELLPALVGKLASTGLGEIEVREGAWKVRVRRPAGGAAGSGGSAGLGRRASDRPSRAQPGHEGHGHAPGALEGHRSARPGAAGHSTNGSQPPAPRPVGPGIAAGQHPDGARPERRGSGDPHRSIATSPAVGVFQPRADARPGARVRAGDRLGAVDMLGIPHDVVAPADGIVAQVLVEAGDAVEYGQDLIALELTTRAGEGV